MALQLVQRVTCTVSPIMGACKKPSDHSRELNVLPLLKFLLYAWCWHCGQACTVSGPGSMDGDLDGRRRSTWEGRIGPPVPCCPVWSAAGACARTAALREPCGWRMFFVAVAEERGVRAHGRDLRWGGSTGGICRAYPFPRTDSHTGRAIRFSRTCRGQRSRRCGGFLRSPPRCTRPQGRSCAGLPLLSLTRNS